MWHHHYHLWVSTTQIRRERKPTTGGSYANSIVRRCNWRPNLWPSSFHACSAQCSHTFRNLPPSWPSTTTSITSLRALAELSSRSGSSKFQRSCPSSKGTQTFLTTGQYRVAFQSLRSCWHTAPPLRHSRPCQRRACFRFRLSIRVDPFLRWPALKSFSSIHGSQLGMYDGRIAV